MQITRSGEGTAAGPGEWFSGEVFIDPVAVPAGPSRVAAASVHFTPGARTAWHTHPAGQTILVVEGVCLCQRRGAPIDEVRPGDRVFFAPDEEHWHGAPPDGFMTHLAIHQVDENGNAVAWGEHVSDEEYNGPRAP